MHGFEGALPDAGHFKLMKPGDEIIKFAAEDPAPASRTTKAAATYLYRDSKITGSFKIIGDDLQ